MFRVSPRYPYPPRAAFNLLWTQQRELRTQRRFCDFVSSMAGVSKDSTWVKGFDGRGITCW